MNRVTIQRPSQMGWSDSCPFGLGGFTLNETAWHLRLPASSLLYGVSQANNVLEFLALALTLLLLLLDCKDNSLPHQCLLVLGNSTSALGWLYKNGKVQPSSFYHCAVNLIARKVALILVTSTHCLASQHLWGKLNVVSNLLSYSGLCRSNPHPLASDNPTDCDLTARFHAHLPQLIPSTFTISHLPAELSSFAILVLQTAKLSYIQNKRAHMKDGTESGRVGLISATNWVSPITLSSISYRTGNGNYPADHFSPCTAPLAGTDQEQLLDTVCSQWFQTLSVMPQAMWLQRFGTISNGASFTSQVATSLPSPSARSSEPSMPPTQPLNDIVPQPLGFFDISTHSPTTWVTPPPRPTLALLTLCVGPSFLLCALANSASHPCLARQNAYSLLHLVPLHTARHH
jgi:hypothetical protein